MLKKYGKKSFVLLLAFIGLVLFLLIRNISRYQVHGDAMLPALQNGASIFVRRVVVERLNRGDLVLYDVTKVAESPLSDGGNLRVGRIVGLPGEEVSIELNKVYINGELLIENYLLSTTAITSGNSSWKMNEDEYFIMGDNRPRSIDSRSWGPISSEEIRGEIVLKI